MKTYLVTGCAGFIGSNFVHYMLEKYEDIRLINLDKLTYAGNLENLQDIEGDARHIFVQGDICDKELVESLFAKYDFDYVINFAAESHVDRSIKNPEIFVQSNVMGTVNLLQRAKSVNPLKMMNLPVKPRSFARRTISVPRICGIRMSNKTKSGLFFIIKSKASAPFAASPII